MPRDEPRFRIIVLSRIAQLEVDGIRTGGGIAEHTVIAPDDGAGLVGRFPRGALIVGLDVGHGLGAGRGILRDQGNRDVVGPDIVPDEGAGRVGDLDQVARFIVVIPEAPEAREAAGPAVVAVIGLATPTSLPALRKPTAIDVSRD